MKDFTLEGPEVCHQVRQRKHKRTSLGGMKERKIKSKATLGSFPSGKIKRKVTELRPTPAARGQCREQLFRRTRRGDISKAGTLTLVR